MVPPGLSKCFSARSAWGGGARCSSTKQTKTWSNDPVANGSACTSACPSWHSSGRQLRPAALPGRPNCFGYVERDELGSRAVLCQRDRLGADAALCLQHAAAGRIHGVGMQQLEPARLGLEALATRASDSRECTHGSLGTARRRIQLRLRRAEARIRLPRLRTLIGARLRTVDWIDVLEGVDAHHRVQAIVDPARDHRHDAAARADEELRRCRWRHRLSRHARRHPRSVTSSAPVGFDVQTPPCFWQNVQFAARAPGSPSGPGPRLSEDAMFPQSALAADQHRSAPPPRSRLRSPPASPCRSRPFTSTKVLAGLIAPNTSPCARAASCQREMSVEASPACGSRVCEADRRPCRSPAR